MLTRILTAIAAGAHWMRTTTAFFICAGVLTSAPGRTYNVQELLDQTRAVYAALDSYSDTGVVVHEYGTSSQDQHTFNTSFKRNPRGFLLDFHKQGGDRYVIWGEPEAFHTWWKTTGQQYDYKNPNNASAISGSSQNTSGAALKIPTLLYGKSSLAAALLNMEGPAVSGTENLGGGRCYRVTGRASDRYSASGAEVNVHRITLWVDAESLLIRQVVEEWTPLPGQRSRLITTYQPQANPALTVDAVRFIPPVK